MRKNYTESRIALPSARIKARDLLRRVDITEFDVLVDRATGQAILWFRTDKGKEIEIRCSSQRTISSNLAAIMLWLHSRIINLERGIETFDNAFSGYLRLPGSTDPRYARADQASDIFNQDERNAFHALGLEKTAAWPEIEKKYKSLAKTFHPDRAMDEDHRKDLEERMADVNIAYSRLKRSSVFGGGK